MSSGARGREKRRHERVRISSIKKLHNLSQGGAYVATKEPKLLGKIFLFELKLGQKGQVFKALARVVRVLHQTNPKTGLPAGMAIQFVSVSEEDSRVLKELLEEYKLKPEN